MRTEPNRSPQAMTAGTYHENKAMRDTNRPLFKQSAETIAVCSLMREAKIGDVVTYEAMRLAIKSPVSKGRLSGAIGTARKIMRRDHDMVFGTIPTVGCKRLTQDEVLEESSADLRGIQNRAQTATEKLGTIDPSQLAPAEQGKLSARMAIFAAVSGWFSTARQKRLPDSGGPKQIQ